MLSRVVPHVILNQARVNGLLLQEMGKWDQKVEYGWDVKRVEVQEDKVGDPEAYCVKVVAGRDGREEEFFAKYALVSLVPGKDTIAAVKVDSSFA